MDTHPGENEAQEMNILSASPTLSILNPYPRRAPGPSFLHQLVRRISPDHLPAIEYQAVDGTLETISYAELHERAEALSRMLVASRPRVQEQGQRQLVVPVLLPQCPELYISQLAILKAGGAFCPLNLDAPPERVRFILGDVDAKVIVTSTALRHQIDALGLDVAVVTADQDIFGRHIGPNEGGETDSDVKPDSLAYVMYTSGSTGTPKGVGISHDAATQALLAHDPHIPSFSRFLQFAAPTFDVSVFEIFFPLFRGVTLVGCSRPALLNDLPTILRTLRVDACELTPTVAGSLLRTRANAPDLRILLTIGEMLTEPIVKEFGGSREKSSILWAMYGPTEATIHCTLQPSCEASASSHHVGFPLDTVSAFVLEPSMENGTGDFQILPKGQLGELAVGGHQLAVGYINRPEQTAKVFVDTPYGRLYRTGDKALMREDGALECYGRISDGQVKLRGQRIELGEVEQAVLRTQGCHGAVASVVQGVIVVFCEHDDPQAAASDNVFQTCRNWLPSFMVPGDVVIMQNFPRLPSGKVDRKRLKGDYQASQEQRTYSSPSYHDSIEQELADIIEDVLDVRLASSSVLSAVGVDSLVAIKLAARLRRGGYTIGAIDVLQSRTLSHLRLRTHKAGQTSMVDCEEASQIPGEITQIATDLGLIHHDIERVVPCAPVQVSMLAETLKRPEAYCNWVELHMPATQDVNTIVAWFREAARCNEILRTGFITSRNGLEQVIWKQTAPVLVNVVHRLDRRYRLNDKGLARPFAVQILANRSRKPTSILLQIHHALYDGWSLDLLLADLNSLARGETLEQRPPFRLLSAYYHSPQFLRDAVTAREYWADCLLGFQPTPMPQMLAKSTRIDQPLSAQKILDVDASAVRTAATRLEISTQVFFQACLLWLWGAILGTEDVVIGNVTSGRTVRVQGVEDVIGPCLTTIPLRTRITQAQTVKELLQSIHMSNRESLAHCTLPLPEIKKVAGLSLGQPLYDALFVYQESVPSREGQQATTTIRQVAHEDYLETKLLVEVEPLVEGFQLRTTYHADVFHHGYMQLFLRQFERILAHIIVDTEASIASIASCFSGNLIAVHNSQPKTLQGVADLATLFEKAAVGRCERPAIWFLRSTRIMETISYNKLNRLANQIARHLRALGVLSNQTVAIIMEKSVMLYAAILGVLKCGCAYLPLLPSTPSERVKAIFSQAGPQLCIHDASTDPRTGNTEVCNFLSLEESTIAHYEHGNLGTPVNPSRIANIIYTSGSTGVPKGVCVSQLNICSNLDVLSRIYPVKEGSRMLQACSQAFDVSVFEILFALTRGMCLCSATNDTLFADFEASLRTLEVTHISMTPTVASLIEPSNVPKVEFLVTSGEPMTNEVARKWAGKLYQGYGPSETTNICSVKKMNPDDHIRHLGFTFENTSAVVLSLHGLDAMPIGAVGELCFGGDQVVPGYLNLSSVTNEKFIHHPVYGRLYRSGDIGRMLADGSLLIVGRVDDQIKLRGQRIELGEVNVAVATTGACSNCVTLLVNSESSVQLACYYVPSPSSDGNVVQVLRSSRDLAERNRMIYDALRNRLPGYMIPSYLIPISTVPMTSSGKVDKIKLKRLFAELDPSDLQTFGADAEPGDVGGQWSHEEENIGVVVAEVLGVPLAEVGRWTPLTSLGLDSISAISVAKALQERFSQRITISAILRNTSIARLSTLLTGPDKSNQTAFEETPVSLLPPQLIETVEQEFYAKGLDFEGLLPCTPLQEAMLASSSGSSNAYLNKMLLRLNHDAVDMKSLWAAMFQRHGILRTCFFSTTDREYPFVQAVLKQWMPRWLAFNTDASSIDDIMNEHAATVPPVINSGIPAISLATTQDGNALYLSFICHHAYYDGVAISRLFEEIEGVVRGIQLSPAPSYEPFLREILRLPESTEAFWKARLAGYRPKTLPSSPKAGSGYSSLTQNLAISYSDIRDRLKVFNSTLLPLVQASWASLLHIVQECDDICFGNIVNGRTLDIEGLNELVAPCFNTVPLRINLGEQKSSLGVIKTFQSLNLETMQYQFTKLRRIQTWCSPQGARLFDTLLLLQQAPRVPDDKLWTLLRDDGDMDVPLACEITPLPSSNSLEVKIHFDRLFVSDGLASFMHNTLAHLIEKILQYPSSSISSKASLPVELKDELEQLALVHPKHSVEDRSPDTILTEAWTQTEKTIRSILSTISRVQEGKVSRHMTIFQMGLDSINAVQVAALLRERGFANVTSADVLESPSCAKLAIRLESIQLKADQNFEYDIAGFQKRARQSLQHSDVTDWEAIEAVLPCSPLQKGMLVEYLGSKGRNYFNFLSFHLNRDLSGNIFSAWCKLVEVYEILRTGFTALDLENASFAMLQYKFREDAVPILGYKEGDSFSLDDWKEEATRDVYRDIKLPPWRVAVVRDPEGIQMHLAFHHAIYDAQSLQFLFTELKDVLSGRLPAHRPGIAVVVQDLITNTHRSRDDDKVFWEKQASLAVINTFPTMTPLKEANSSLLVKERVCTLPLKVLKDCVKEAGVTIQAVAQVAWLRILASYLGENSVVFGTILSGRTSDTTREAIFPCITTVPVFGQHLSSNSQALQAMMEYNTGLQRHQRTPLTDIKRWVGHPNTKLFDTLLVYQKLEQYDKAMRPWQVRDEQTAVDYSVSMEIEQCQAEGSIAFRITFAENILPVEQATLLLNQFDALFCSLAEFPDGEDEGLRNGRPDLFAILPPEEPELKSDIRFLHEFVETSAQLCPDKVALEFVSGFRDGIPTSRQWTYKELCANGNRVANILCEHVNTGDIVAICFDKCPEAHFAMLGILKAGCALLALDPSAPSSRKEFILQDSGAVALLTDQTRSVDLDFDVAVPVLAISETLLQEAHSTPFELSRPLESADRSYCLYTSGTTGTPKGCEITHENAVQAMLAFQKLFEGHWDANSRWLQFASYHFDVSVLEQYWTWSVGITLFAAPRDVILEDLVGTISSLQITHIDLTPSLARLIHPDDVPSLCRGVFITGGEQLKQEILDVWGPRRVIHNFYGPTEATIGVTTYPRVPINGKSSNIGKQFANVGSYVLRPGTEIPVLRGGVGELCVSGKLVGKGYLNREDLTSERFPTLKAYGERVYRTGDLVRVLHDGCFDFLGRADDQVKLRGQRLEIGEINHCIRSGVPEIKDVVTVVVRNERQQKDLLVAFVVTAQDEAGGGELRIVMGRNARIVSGKAQRACREKLPGYMVPTYFLLLPFIPLSPNNKAELKVLRTLFSTLSPEQLIAPSSTISIADLGEIGKMLRRALSQLTDVAEEDISPASSIFELGVDSISVMRLARMLNRGGIQNARPATILRNPILADLSEALGGRSQLHSTQSRNNGTLEAQQAVEACQHRHRAFVCRTLGVKAREIEYIAPCSALQQGMISRSRAEEGSGAYFNTFRFELAEGISLPRLRAAWEMLLIKHSILRTRFISTSEGHIQVSLKEVILPWSEISLRHDQAFETLLDERLRAWMSRNELNIEVPWELHVVSKDEKKWLAVHIFHGIYDATSFDLMIDEVAKRYKGEESDVAEGPSFLDALLHGPLENLSFSESFWVDHLKGIKSTSTSLPQLSTTPSDQDLAMSRRIEFASLEKLRKTLGVTQQAIIQALWSLVLQCHLSAGAAADTFGIILSGRAMGLENVENTIGPLFNTVPYHYRLSKKSRTLTWSSVVRQCHEFNMAVLPFQHVPLRDIQKWCSGSKPIFNSLFSFQRRVSAMVRQSSNEGLWRECESGLNADYPLAFEATLDPEGDVLDILLVAQRGVADEYILADFLDEFETKAKSMARNPEGLCHDPDDLDIPGGEEDEDNSISEARITPAQQVADSYFEWTPQAQAIRQQIALLSEMEEASVTEFTTLLELGLDSIDTVKLSARLKRAGIVLSNSDLIRGQSIARLAILLADRESQAKGTGVTDSGYSSEVEDYPLHEYLVGIGSDLIDDIEQVLPPTPLQDSMVFEMINSDFQLYFNHDVLQVSADTDVARLKEAWALVVRVTPILRTVFVEVESQAVEFAFMQLIRKTTDSAFSEADVSSSDEIASIQDQAREKALLGRGRSDLFQVTFAKAPQATFVVLSIAHALYDGWSLGLLHQDVEAAYHDIYAPRPAYAGYLGQLLRSSRKGSHDSFWSDYISDARRTILPDQQEAGELPYSINRSESWMKLPATTLKAFCKRHAISQQALAQTCWAAVLATYMHRLDVTFGVVLSGRETEASEAMLFPTMNTVPVRAVFHSSVASFLRYMQDNMTNISQFQHYPLRKIQALAQQGQGGLFNTLFMLQKGSESVRQGEALMYSVEGTSAVEYPVCVEMEVVGMKLLWRTACDSRYLSSDRMAQLLKHIEQVLDYLVSSSDEGILKFDEDGGVSICGLTSFQPQTNETSPEQLSRQTEEDGSDDDVWTSTEGILRDVMAQMAGVDHTSVKKHHNLYHLGLDSIRAIKVSSALRKRGVTATVRDLIQATSIRDMAAKASASQMVSDTIVSEKKMTVDEDGSSAGAMLTEALRNTVPVYQTLASAGLESAEIMEVFPATAMQTHMLSVWQNTNGAVFFPEFHYRLVGGSHDMEDVEQAWHKVVEQNCILRTLFLATGLEKVPFLQVTLPPTSSVGNPFVSLAVHHQEDENDKALLLRIKIHHALYDGFSLPLIMDQFRRALLGSQDSMASIKISSERQQSLAWKSFLASTTITTDEIRSKQRMSFWTQYLANLSSNATTTSQFHQIRSKTADTRLSMNVDSDSEDEFKTKVNDRVSMLRRAAVPNTTRLKALCTQHGVSLQAVFLAAYAHVLASPTSCSSYGGSINEVVFGVYLANRAASHGLAYPTLCLVPIRVQVQDGPEKLFETAAQVQRDLHRVSAAENISVGLWEVKQWTGVLVDSFVNFLSLPDEDEESLADIVRLEAVHVPEIANQDHNEMDPNVLAWVRKNAVRGAYPDAVDIEASIQGDGAMDIGVFGSCTRLGQSGRDVIDRIVQHLSVS